jgi:hypothetical protein
MDAYRGVQNGSPAFTSCTGTSGTNPRIQQAMQVQAFAGIPLDIGDFPTRHNYGLALWQSHFERILAAWVGELRVPIAREREVTGFAQDDTGVDVELFDGQSLRADTSSGATEGAVWSERRPGSSSLAGMRRPAG